MAGRPRHKYTDEQKIQIETMARIGCTWEEISAELKIPIRSLKRHFGTSKAEGLERFRVSLRRMQYESARAGNVVMQKWLGIQYLEQSDKADQITINADKKEIKVEIVRRKE